jgi:hypothetical protein
MLTMHLRNETSEELIRALRNDGTSDRQQLSLMMHHAQCIKPKVGTGKYAAYDKHHERLAQMYANNQEPFTREELAMAFPETHQRMAVETHGITKRTAVEEGVAYSKPPERWVTVNGLRFTDGEVVDADTETADPVVGEKQAQFNEMVHLARLHKKLLEVGRRVVISGTTFVRIGWRNPIKGRAAIGNVGHAVLDVYWPHQVQVATHHSAPNDLYSAYLLIATAPGPDGHWAEVWRRECFEDESGELTGFGPWRAERIPVGGDDDDDDKRVARPLFGDGEYPLQTLPWVVYHDGEPTHGVFVDAGRDLVRTNLNLNRVSSDDLYSLAQGAHRQVVIQSDILRKEGSDVTWGPGEALLLGSAETASALPPGTTPAARERNEQRLRSLAVERRLPPHRFDTDTTRVESGLAKQVQDIPATDARIEREETYKDLEEEALLPILAEISDYWGHTTIAHKKRAAANGTAPGQREEGVRFHVSFSGQTEYETKEAKERWAGALLDRKVITPARYSVLSDAYGSIEEAEAQGVSNDLPTTFADPLGGPGLDAFERGLGQDEQPQAQEAEGPTVNEMSLTIERLARVGDLDGVNAMREKLSALLGLPHSGDLADLPGDEVQEVEEDDDA